MAKKKTITFQIYKDKSGQYRWRAVHKNGRILADSGESYTRKGRCVTAAANFSFIENKDCEIVII